jgi:hypothetical protein
MTIPERARDHDQKGGRRVRESALKPIEDAARYVSPRQDSRLLGISVYLLYKAIQPGQVPHRRIGQRIVIPRTWIDFSENPIAPPPHAFHAAHRRAEGHNAKP